MKRLARNGLQFLFAGLVVLALLFSLSVTNIYADDEDDYYYEDEYYTTSEGVVGGTVSYEID